MDQRDITALLWQANVSGDDEKGRDRDDLRSLFCRKPTPPDGSRPTTCWKYDASGYIHG